MQRSAYHLICDRSKPNKPRWVIAKELRWLPVDDVDALDGRDPGKDRSWLRAFGIDEFEWLRDVFGRDTYVQDTGGQEGLSTRLCHPGDIWTEYSIEPDGPGTPDEPDGADVPYSYDDIWGAEYREPGWYDPDRWADGVADD